MKIEDGNNRMSDNTVYVVMRLKYTEDIPLGYPKPIVVFKNESDAKFLVANSTKDNVNQEGERIEFSYVKVSAY